MEVHQSGSGEFGWQVDTFGFLSYFLRCCWAVIEVWQGQLSNCNGDCYLRRVLRVKETATCVIGCFPEENFTARRWSFHFTSHQPNLCVLLKALQVEFNKKVLLTSKQTLAVLNLAFLFSWFSFQSHRPSDQLVIPASGLGRWLLQVRGCFQVTMLTKTSNF